MTAPEETTRHGPRQVWRSLSKWAGRRIQTKADARQAHAEWILDSGITTSSIQWRKGVPYVVYREQLAPAGAVMSFLHQYLKAQKSRVSPEYHRQITHYMSRFRQFCRENGILWLRDLTRSHVEAFGESLPPTAGPVTRRRHLEAVRAVLRSAADDDLIDYRVSRNIRMPVNRDTQRKVVLTDDQIRHIQDEWPEPERVFALTMIWAGLRLRETTFLLWDDIDFEASEISLTAKLDFGFSPKGTRYRDGAPDRVPMVPWLAGYLDELPRIGRFVWDSGADTPLYVDKWWATLLKRRFRASGMPNASAHTCRHTFCTKLALSGVNRAVMPLIARHTDPAMTDRYVHATLSDSHAEIAKLRPV